MAEFGPKDLTPEQAAAYVNGTCMVVLSELLSAHWANVQATLPAGTKLPFGFDEFQRRSSRHCVSHDNMMRLFEISQGK